MNRFCRQGIIILSVCVAQVAFAEDALRDQLLPDVAETAANEVSAGLQECGLSLVDPHAPGMPYPRQDARYAVVNQNGRVLAYFLQGYARSYYGTGAEWLWMNPNGSYRHSIRFNNSQIQFATPYAGNVASANRYTTVNGPGYNFYCRSLGGMVRTVESFMQCARRDFVEVIKAQLCQHGTKEL